MHVKISFTLLKVFVHLMSPQIFTQNNHNASKHGPGKDRLGTFGSSDYSHLTAHGGIHCSCHLTSVSGYSILVLQRTFLQVTSYPMLSHATDATHYSLNLSPTRETCKVPRKKKHSSGKFHVVSLIGCKLQVKVCNKTMAVQETT